MVNNNKGDRYSDYVHRLRVLKGLPPAGITRDIIPLRDIPHKADPRRQRSLQHVLDIQRTQEEKFPDSRSVKSKDPIPWILRRIVVPPRRSAPLTDIAHMPNCRDPRRFRACRRRTGKLDSCIGSPNLVENSEIPAEEETCPVLTVDVTEWPMSIHSYIELIPHECNILRASEFVSAPNSSEQLVNCDNENVNVLLETMRESDDVMEVEDDDVTEVSGYDAGDSTKPMLAMDDNVYGVELPSTNFLGDDELLPIPVVKSEPTVIRPVPSFDETDIDMVDLCDDDDMRLLVPKRERSSSVECVGQKVQGPFEVITLDSDDDDDGDCRRNTTPAEQHVRFTAGAFNCSPISSSLGSERRGERDSACAVAANDNGVSDDATISQSHRELVQDKQTPIHADAEIREARDSDAISVFANRKRTPAIIGGVEVCKVQDNVINSDITEFSEIRESLTDIDRPESSVTLCAKNDEARTTKTGGVGVDNNDASESDLPVQVKIEKPENLDNDPCLLNNAPRRISIVTSDAFAAQKKRLIDVISNSIDDAKNDSDTPSRSEKTTNHETMPAESAGKQLQRVINDMTCANFVGRSIFSNRSTKDDYLACSELRNRQESPENIVEVPGKTCLEKEKRQESPKNSEEVPQKTSSEKRKRAVSPEKKICKRGRKKSCDEDVNIVIKPSEQPTLKENPPANVPNTSTTIALLENNKFLQFLLSPIYAPPILTSTIFTFDRALLNHLIDYVRNHNIARSSLEYMLRDSGGLSIVRAMQVVNEIFWRNRYNHWNDNDWDRSICSESSELPINEETIDIVPKDDQTKNQVVDASYFLRYSILKANKPVTDNDMTKISQDSQFYSVRHTFQTNSKIRQNTNQGFKSNQFGTNSSNSEIKKIQKYHSLPTVIVPQSYNYSKLLRSKSHDSLDNQNNNIISPIKLTLTRDQTNQQNWIASHAQESISECDNMEKVTHEFKCFIEKSNLKQKSLISDKHHTEFKKSCHLTIDVTKIQSCDDKTVPELENNDYISTPVINDYCIEKQSLEGHLSTFLKSRVKRWHRLNEAEDVQQSNFTSKRQKLSEHALDSNVNINTNINYINNHLDHRSEQERRPIELSQSFNDFSKKDLPKNLELRNVSNLNSSLNYKDNHEKHDERPESNRTLQVDHNSNIAKDNHKKQKISSPERSKLDISMKKKRKSVEIDEKKKRKIGRKLAEIFGDSDSDEIEILGSASNFASFKKEPSNDNYIDSDHGHRSIANCKTNAVLLDKNNINTTPLEKSSEASKIETVNHLELEQTKHLSSLMQENQDSKESVETTELTSDINKLSEHSSKAMPSEKSCKNVETQKRIETNSTENCIARLSLEETSNILSNTSQSNFEIRELHTDSVTISTKTNEFLDNCISKVQSDVPSTNISSNTTSGTLNSANCDLSNDDSIEIMDLQEGDFDFEVDNNSVYSYDGCVHSDAAESEDLSASWITVENLVDNESANSAMPEAKNQHLPVSERSEVTSEQNNDHCLDKSPTSFDECIVAELSNKRTDSTGNNDKEATTCDSKSDNLEGNNDYENVDSSMDSDDRLIICESPVQNEVLSSTILSPNQNALTTFDNDEILNNSNKKTSLLSNNDTTEPTSTVSLPDRKLYNDLKNPHILKKYNLFQEETIPEEKTSETFTESIVNIEEQQAFESLNKTNSFTENSTIENITEVHSNRLTNNQPKCSIEKFQKFNIHYVDIDTNEINNLDRSTDNSNSTVRSFQGTFKVRNINDLLEKPQTMSKTNTISTNEICASKVETTKSEKKVTFSNLSELMFNSISSSLDQLILTVNSIPFKKQIVSSAGINIVPQTNNQSCANVLPANTLLQSMALPNDSQVCFKLASNMFSNEFSTTNDLPTIYSMESPSMDSLKLLLPVTTKEELEIYKKLLMNKLDSNLELLQKLSGEDFIRLSNDLFNYNTLSLSTWNFQKVILTTIQCISRLIYCAKGENKRLIIKIIEKTINLSKYKQGCLKEAVIIFKKLADQGLCHKHIFLYDPLLVEVADTRNLTPNKHFKMNNSQINTYFKQIIFYRSIQKLPIIGLSDLKTIVGKSTSTRQINSFQSSTTNSVNTTVPNLQNVQVSQRVQHIQTMQTPSFIPQLNRLQILPLSTNYLPKQACSMCKKVSGFMIVCNFCNNTNYCSLNCEERDWEQHSKICKQYAMFKHLSQIKFL